ncbi:MAG: hypothetical protein IJ632_03865 [Muribaculaceae bacterium]|nr:hypothetical protein [Muribaculaceae bacterium]
MTHPEKINEYFNSRGFTVVSALMLAIAAGVSLVLSPPPVPDAGSGILFSAQWSTIDSPTASAFLNVACIIGIGLLMLALNKVFNFVRSYTFIFTSVFFLLEMSTPLTCGIFNTGTTLCLVLLGGILLLFSSYQDKHSQHSIFLLMAVLATCSLFQYAFLLLIPAFCFGFMYMRAMNVKGFLAMLLGLLTPIWIVLGLGIAHLTDFKPFGINAIWESLDLGQMRMLVVTAATTTLLAIVLTAMNLLTIMNYRLQLRVYNAFFVMMSALAIIAMSIDYKDMTAFLPILFLCLSVQVAHSYTLSTFSHRYLFIIALMALAIASCTAHLLQG